MWWSEDNFVSWLLHHMCYRNRIQVISLGGNSLPYWATPSAHNHHAIPCKQTGKCWKSDCFTRGLTGDLTVLWFHIYLCKINVQQWFSQGSFLFRNLVKMFLNIAGSSTEAIRCLRAVVALLTQMHEWTQQNFSWQVFKSGVARLGLHMCTPEYTTHTNTQK